MQVCVKFSYSNCIIVFLKHSKLNFSSEINNSCFFGEIKINDIPTVFSLYFDLTSVERWLIVSYVCAFTLLQLITLFKYENWN